MVRVHHVPVTRRGLTIWLDTFLDRVAAAPQVGLTAAEVDEVDEDIFVSHCHFDHILGANVVALRTGAHVVGSYEAMRLMNEAGVPLAQQWPVSGGEVVDCGLLPPFMNGTNVDAAAEALRSRTPWAELVTMTYGEPVALFG
jgi:glyoxylase-like metal-dependent hydrolase (beta-lactamase superfamily II)